ncbi:MAG: hypothetical protein APF81_16905 [Desulfosporosinus sp. BRH_c37]|nr:MAG: hypothetical protein APF81_16905 [Desulfosporosinus sp. BRH_c37]
MKKTIITILLLFILIIVILLHLNVEDENPNDKTIKNSISELPSETISKPPLESEFIPTLLPTPTPATHNIKPDFSNVIFIGDSITFGFINAHNTPVEKDHVYAKIGAHVFEGSKLLGDNSKMITDRCNGSVDYVFLMFGANDYGYNMNAYKNWYKELIKYIKQMFPNSKIVIQSVMPMNSTAKEPNRNQEPQKLNYIIKAVAIEEDVQFMDVSKFIPNAKKMLLEDGLHFKPELYPLWITAIVNSFN